MKTLHCFAAGLRLAYSVIAWWIAFPLLCLCAELALLQPCAGQGGTWSITGSLITARLFHTATLLPNGKVLVAGGNDSEFFNVGSAELYDPVSGTWTATGFGGGGVHPATLLSNGKVLVEGGYDRDGGFASAFAALYDPASETWTTTGSLATGRASHTATLLPDGKVLVAGGFDSDFFILNSAELYDPTSGTWTPTGNLVTGRFRHTATLLPNGKVLVAGGFGLTNAELYDPASGTWTTTGSLATGRDFHTATLLPNGKVLVAAGYDGGLLASAELYDSATGIWTATGSLTMAREQHTATLLVNGKVLVAGGQGSGDLTSAELYDPATGTWAATGSLATGRDNHTATLLPDGKVLVAGGYNFDIEAALSSAELYTPETTNEECVPPPDGLVSWWSGDRTAEDVQGVNPGVLKNGASFARAMVGPGFLFDGIDDGVVIPNSASLSQAHITLDAWVYVTGKQGTARHIISKDNELKTREYILGIGVENSFVADVWLASGIVDLRNTTTAQLNTWYHIAMTHDGLKLRLYVNGILDGSADAVGDIVPTVNPVGIGGNSAPVFFQGIVDEAQIFNRALSDAEILAIYQAGADGQCKPNIFVASIDPSYTASGHGFRISTSIAIQDVNGVGINGATGQLGVILPSGSALTFPLKTDATGQADVSFTTPDSGLYQFKVRNVKHPTREYDASLNIETTDTLVIP